MVKKLTPPRQDEAGKGRAPALPLSGHYGLALLNARNCWQDHLGQGAAMVQDAPITPQALLAEITPSAPAFSLTRVIGAKLCALYDETSEPYPERLTELLRALDAEIFGNA